MKISLPEFLKRRLAEREAAVAAKKQQQEALARLEASLKPNPSHRTRRLAQMSPERAARYRKNISEMGLAE